jgi:TonB-linked SusC/RagA family outer membrane protein
MVRFRHVYSALVAGLLGALPLAAQEPTGAVAGQVTDSLTQRPLLGVEVSIIGMTRRVVTDQDGRYVLTGVPVGPHIVQTALIGYGLQQQPVNVTAGGSATVDFALRPQAALLEPVVVTGYTAQRREAITGSVSSIEGTAANVGVVTNVDQMVQGRAAGVQITQINGEPGAGSVVLIRGGSSISATNDPLYVIDGVPIDNAPTEPDAYGIGGAAALPRNPLNLINPSDIASINILKDAAATAIYGSRAANGVILIETKQGRSRASGPSIEYEGYASTSSPARKLDVLNGGEYRQFVQSQVALWQQDSASGVALADRRGLPTVHAEALGPANTNWENAITRSAITHNHNISYSGGSEVTRYRASLNYMNQEGVTLSSGLERIQGRLSATHSDLNGRLRLGVNVMTSHINNTYLTYENGYGGFEGGVFQNVAIFNPTQPITVTDATGTHFFEFTGSTSVRNPVAMADQITNKGQTTRTLANASADFDLTTGLTARVNVSVDHSNGDRQEYYPNSNPVGQQLGGGLAQQQALDNSQRTLQTTLAYQREVGTGNTVDIVGGYEYTKHTSNWVEGRGIGFFTDAFSFNNLAAANTRETYSYADDYRLASFFGQANVGFQNRFHLTGVLRYDGSSKFAVGHKWALFPALSGSWDLSREGFLSGGPFSDLRVRVGWGLQGNPGVAPYSSLVTLAGGTDATYAWGDQAQGGVIPTSNGNPNLKWEQTSQVDGAVDFSVLNNRISASVEYYVKNTKDLLLEVPVSQPAVASTQLQNVGRLRKQGLEISLDAVALSRPGLQWRAGLVFARERNKVIDLGPFSFINSGNVSGQGQTGQMSERIIPGQPLGTFYGPVYVGTDAAGHQLFKCAATTPGCVNGQSTTADPADYAIIGNANPNFTLGVHSSLNWGRFDVSFLIHASVGQDVFNNTALVYSTKGNALQDKNFLRPALTDPTGLHEPAIFSSRWIENGSFVRLQNITVGYDLNLPILTNSARSARLYVSADNLVLLTGYSGLDPEVYTQGGLAVRGLDYLSYPRPRTITGGLRLTF